MYVCILIHTSKSTFFPPLEIKKLVVLKLLLDLSQIPPKLVQKKSPFFFPGKFGWLHDDFGLFDFHTYSLFWFLWSLGGNSGAWRGGGGWKAWFFLWNPTTNGGMQSGSSVGTCTLCMHVFGKFGANLRVESMIINKISASEISRKFVKGALLVGRSEEDCQLEQSCCSLLLGHPVYFTTCKTEPNQQWWHAKWKFSRNMYTLRTRFCTFGADLRAQSVLINKISASEISRKFVKGALLVGRVRSKRCILFRHFCLQVQVFNFDKNPSKLHLVLSLSLSLSSSCFAIFLLQKKKCNSVGIATKVLLLLPQRNFCFCAGATTWEKKKQQQKKNSSRPKISHFFFPPSALNRELWKGGGSFNNSPLPIKRADFLRPHVGNCVV